jgi:hypothetical protein
MSLQIDLERLLQAAQASGALSGNMPQLGLGQLGRKEASLTLSTLGSMYGCCGLFDMCGSNDLLSLTIEGEPFLDWLGFKPNNECNQFVKLIQYIGPAGTSTSTEGTGAAAACADAAGVEFGVCEVLLPDKGRLKRSGPVRDLTENNRKVCEQYPVFMKDGKQITDELMWSVTLAGIAIKQDFKRMVITGNAGTANQFAGLNGLVNTGYVDARFNRRCSAMDSQVINWGSHAMSYALNGTHVLVDYLIDLIRRIRMRASWANMGSIAVGDQVLVMPSYLRDCLLDAFTCWSVCPGAQYNEANLNTLEARTFRNTLNGGGYGMGQIFVDSVPVPIITYDWMALGQAAPNFTGDIFVLTRRIGNVPVLWGQYIDMTQPAARFAEEAGYAHYRALDGGKFLSYWKTDNECTQSTVVFRPNLYLSAPWAQARIQNVACLRPLNPLSADPTSSYFAEEYLSPAACPEDYLTPSQA